MELRVSTTPGSNLPVNCHVGVRVGDVLKQGRYEPQRCYHFPTVDRRRNAKIDIYRHVGSCVLAVDPDVQSVHEVSVASTDPTLPEVKLKVNVQPGPRTDNRREEKTKEVKTQAKDYLTKHSIEEKLASAVKAMLKEEPADPTDFLCRYLVSIRGDSVVTSAPVVKIGAPVGRPTGQIVLSQGKFTDYYKAQCLPNVSPACYDAIYSKFPEALKRLRPLVPAEAGGERSIEDIRKQSRAILLRATKDGGLQSALTELGPDSKRGSSGGQANESAPAEDSERTVCVMASNKLMGPQFYSLGLPNTLRVI